ncbi:LOW QUALITY PROTEIN: Eukaryotic/viral aspartic protease [Phytophthora megakarya]|uniref:Eukaryotic/viral aspartic protease n=1 Tax=Phytophthora megakarya TaxID=4795 RepID=A0A225VI51_9STRA|nr:LOW QUALITY PROTEIN: Eukaryotic/viral aspartic protease [Phytophthora megakarya]
MVIDSECLYACTGKCEWPENSDNNNENEKNVEFNGEYGVCLDGGTLHEFKKDTTTRCLAGEHMKLHRCKPRWCGCSLESIWDDATIEIRPTSEDANSRARCSERCKDFDPKRTIITTELARRLRLDPIEEHGRQLEVQGIQEGNMSTTTRVKAKVTLGWNTVHEFEFWVMDHSAGSEVVLGTDFMIPAGICLHRSNATAKLPGEEMVPLVKSLSADEDSAAGMHLTGGPMKSLQIPAGEWIEFRLQK